MRLRFMGVTPAESVARIDSSIRKMVALADTEQGGDPDFSGVRVDDFIWLSDSFGCRSLRTGCPFTFIDPNSVRPC
ncbi:MAG: hypothetical protein VXY07_08065 [Planctomycetota bacterium]|nr:hypothetical protein [Planctomycetota bacterium]